tara:strand:- start:12548 stop:13243 length:696 start_codon:yes stop_codon:yes gene_type:complete
MGTYDTLYQLNDLMDDFKSCATAAGFCTVKFGKPTTINFDHNICYDLLNIDYPTSYVAEGVKEVYTFKMILARPFSKSTTQGVQVFDTEVVQIFADLEIKMWNMLSCLALGISGGGGCKAHIPKHKIQIVRDKGTFNDNLVTLQVQFDAIANIAVTVDPCGGGSSGDGCDSPCADYFGACGCTDPLAINYDPGAGTDDGTCCYGEGEEPCVDTDPVFPPVYPAKQTNNPVS